MKIVVAVAVVAGLVIGVAFAAIQTNADKNPDASASTTDGELNSDPRKDLPLEVLKSLPDEELAEIFPEKAEAILNPEIAEQFATGGKKSDDPEYLRAVLEKMGVTPPAEASTKELQELLASTEQDFEVRGK